MKRLALAAGVLLGFAVTVYALATYGERACDRLEASGWFV